ncbi:DUF1786 domain-containing protein [uncultured Methanobrevibacter sp.]|uniref:DUF1786 domain-containing protein n=1 Tax=uncultured Methanobrevibacter sp. TaxID=253161 RepID=UPI0025CC9AFC|nr:DUF1786 domain-containing protein [uncultured Methanobrevibacter sp.]
MKILAIDVGTGTEDILLYDTEKEIENSMKLVIPSPHLTVGQLISQCQNDIYFDGVIMGGGKIKDRCIEHMEKGYKVVFEDLAARTIRDNIDQVKSYGFEVADENAFETDPKYADFTKISLKDVDVNHLIDIFRSFDLDLEVDELIVAVQDHGYSEDMGDRDFRFEKIKEKLPEPLPPESFAMEMEEVPEYFTRMQSVIKSLAKDNPEFKPVLMDTKFASLAGVCYDKEVSKLNSYVVMDIGNGHTTAASIEDGKIQGVFEHHTRDLSSERLEELVLALADGTIKHEDVHDEGGHGAFALNPISNLEKVIVAGPKRALIEGTNLDYYHAAPGGDVMMTGTVGLVKSMEFLRK